MRDTVEYKISYDDELDKAHCRFKSWFTRSGLVNGHKWFAVDTPEWSLWTVNMFVNGGGEHDYYLASELTLEDAIKDAYFYLVMDTEGWEQ